MNLLSRVGQYNSAHKCLHAPEKIRGPNGVACLGRGTLVIPELPVGGKWQCASCPCQFTATAGTIMHDSRLPLRKSNPCCRVKVPDTKKINNLLFGG